eukprot:TRINITY_DN95232_c0_g1_i1.p1 TRINITY_DN95232_c0_g1~~TRINITY_DN95232_c0_g1_i1.p1  ORF type:complete len:283 (+),score=51.53 TRINITY_DN95232_c0_g1_i1:64-912(+)
MADLYTKIGGREPLFQLVQKVYDLMKADSRLGPMFKAEFDFAKLTQRTVDFLEHKWGGDPFQGAICGSALTDKNEVSLLWQAHSRVGVADKDYTFMIGLYEKTLKKMGVSKAVMREILEDLERYRDPIVDTKKKHREKWMNANKIGAAEEAAWQKAAETQRQKEEERKERLAAFRRERKRQEQLEKKREREREKQKCVQSDPRNNRKSDEAPSVKQKSCADAPLTRSAEQNQEPLQQEILKTCGLEDVAGKGAGADSKCHWTLEDWCSTTPSMRHQPIIISL